MSCPPCDPEDIAASLSARPRRRQCSPFRWLGGTNFEGSGLRQAESGDPSRSYVLGFEGLLYGPSRIPQNSTVGALDLDGNRYHLSTIYIEQTAPESTSDP